MRVLPAAAAAMILLCLAELGPSCVSGAQVAWKRGQDWAYACDFYTRDMDAWETLAEACGSACLSTSGCTHFTWKQQSGKDYGKKYGKCHLKSGRISKTDAFFTGYNSGYVCGVVDSGTASSSWIDDCSAVSIRVGLLSLMACTIVAILSSYLL